MPLLLIRRDRAMVAVAVMLDVAFHSGRNATVSAAEIADRVGLARRGLEPLLQALSREGLLTSIRGPRGGYRLGRLARDIRLAEAIAVASGSEAEAGDGPAGTLHDAVVAPLWVELDASVRARLETLTLNDLIRRAEGAGLRRPATEPISFVI